MPCFAGRGTGRCSVTPLSQLQSAVSHAEQASNFAAQGGQLAIALPSVRRYRSAMAATQRRRGAIVMKKERHQKAEVRPLHLQVQYLAEVRGGQKQVSKFTVELYCEEMDVIMNESDA